MRRVDQRDDRTDSTYGLASTSCLVGTN